MANTEESLARFIRANIETVPLATSFSIWVVEAEGASKSRLDRFEVGQFRESRARATELRDLLMQRAKDQAQAMMHITRFIVFARTPKDDAQKGGKETYKARFEFCLRGDAARAMGLTSMETEPPTERGMLAQMMRHNEALMRMTTEGMGQVMEQMTEQIRSLGERATAAESVQVEFREKINNANEDEHKRKMEQIKELNRQERLNALSDQATKLLMPAAAQSLPAILNHFGFGSSLPPMPMAPPTATAPDGGASPPVDVGAVGENGETVVTPPPPGTKSEEAAKLDRLKVIFMELPTDVVQKIITGLPIEKAKELTDIFASG
jgi:hypothetical protein